ncbi:Phage P2 GpU [Pseudovibrio sp. Ad13]|uniref:phage tail protein n=1 Tax=Pseudovibrio sp. Ad13 TaxID=989396 RepID=UPI0007AE7759|nr:phage tail protein [Pseudovibrio sp. Ad13]KZK83619.1 Phage P2 GpU [Pseudovibrio sp. Ad13]
MAGPIPMALGPFLFHAHGFGYTELERTLETRWATQETAGRMHAQQWTGPGSETIRINGVLFPQEFGGQTTLDGVRLAARQGVPLMLVSIGGRVFGSHTIQGVEEAQSLHDRIGTPGQNEYTIELLAYPSSFFNVIGAVASIF